MSLRETVARAMGWVDHKNRELTLGGENRELCGMGWVDHEISRHALASGYVAERRAREP